MTGSKGIASVRQSHRRLGMLRIRAGKGGRGVPLGFQRRQAGSREFLRLKVRFRARNGGLGGGEVLLLLPPSKSIIRLSEDNVKIVHRFEALVAPK